MSNPIQTNNKRIARNTMLLYVRMFVMMGIGLYTSRVILNALGISDYGLYNVASSVVTMFSFLTTTLASGTQRFLSFAIGKKDEENTKRVFANAITLHIILAVIIFILSETFGLWYVYNKLVVDEGRFTAALWCFHLSVVAAVINIIQIPFNSALIAHEKMDIYAYMSIFDAALKLISAYLIMIIPFDRLIYYSVFVLLIGALNMIVYNWYCQKHYSECRFKMGYDKSIFKDMLSFSGWNMFGCVAVMGQSTGVNLVINAFCGTVVNGARAIAFQVNAMVVRFVDNFQVALNPQIFKYYANKDIANMERLVIRGAYMSSYLLLFLAIPLFVECEYVITLWLGNCPEYVVPFVQIVLIESLFKTMGNPTITAMSATGKMKMNQLTAGIIQLMVLPICYILFKMGVNPVVTIAICMFPWLVVIPVRLFWIKKYSGMPMNNFIRKIYIKVTALAILMFMPPFLTHISLPYDGFTRFFIVGLVSVVSSGLIIYYFGIETSVQQTVRNKIVTKAKTFKNKIIK